MGLDDFAPAASAEENLDEDLFDFPPMNIPEPPRAEVEVVAEVATDDLDLSEEGSTAVAKEAKGRATCTGLDPKLDADLFGFPPLDLSSLGAAEPEQLDAELAVAGGGPSVADFLEDDLGDIMRDAHEEQERTTVPAAQGSIVQPVAAAASVASAPVAAAASVASAPVAAAPAAMAAPVQVHTVAAAGPPSKLMLVMTAATILFMCGLLGIAWRATSTFQQQLKTVSDDVQMSTTYMQDATTTSLKEISRVGTELLHNQFSAAKVEPALGPIRALPPMASAHEMTLESARLAITGGRFDDARRMLFGLLAESDRIPAEERQGVERDANFMIAASHKAEAELRKGEQK